MFGTGQLPKFEDDLFKTWFFNHAEMTNDLSQVFYIQDQRDGS